MFWRRTKSCACWSVWRCTWQVQADAAGLHVVGTTVGQAQESCTSWPSSRKGITGTAFWSCRVIATAFRCTYFPYLLSFYVHTKQYRYIREREAQWYWQVAIIALETDGSSVISVGFPCYFRYHMSVLFCHLHRFRAQTVTTLHCQQFVADSLHLLFWKQAAGCVLLCRLRSRCLRWVHTCNVTAYRNAVTASDWHGTELRAELSSRASRRHSILRALHHGVPSLLRGPERILCS